MFGKPASPCNPLHFIGTQRLHKDNLLTSCTTILLADSFVRPVGDHWVWLRV